MRSRCRSFAALFFLAVVPAMLAQAPGKGAARKPRKLSAEEAQALREQVAAQQKQIDTLTQQVQQLLAERRQDQAAAREAHASLQQAQSAAAQAQEAAGAARQSAQQAQATAGQALSAAATEKQSRENAPLVAGWNGEHAFLKSADGNLMIQPYGYLQADYLGYTGDVAPADTFVIRRARLGFQGTLYRHYEFSLLADFADGKSTLLREGALNLNFLDAIQLKAGQFKEPFSQEELVNDPNIDFIERSLVNNLAPAYSPGVQVHGKLFAGIVEYAGGLFNGNGLLANSPTGTPEGVFRLRLTPWASTRNSWLNQLSLAGAIADGRSHLGKSFPAISESKGYTFFPSETVNGQVLRANGEVSWLKGPVGIRAEYDQTNQDRQHLGPGGADLPGVVAKGFYVQGTYLLTRELRPYDGAVRPFRPVLGNGERGWGAWELKFRYSALQFSDGTQRNRASSITTGFNWYLSPFVKYAFDVKIEGFSGPVVSAPPTNPGSAVSVLNRIQFRF